MTDPSWSASTGTMRLNCLLAALAFFASAVAGENQPASSYVSVWDNNDYVVSLIDKLTNHHFCSGALIFRRTVVTTASCLQKQSLINPDQIAVRFSPRSRKQVSVEDIVVHDNYDAEGEQHDIAIVFLKFFISIFKVPPAILGRGVLGDDPNVFALELAEKDQIVARSLTVVNTTFYGFSARNADDKIPPQREFGGPVINANGEAVGLVPFLPKEDAETSTGVRYYPKLEAYKFWIQTVVEVKSKPALFDVLG